MNKVLIVTGGSRGIGAATALLAAKQGYGVCVNYQTRVNAADSVVGAILAEGGRAIAVAGDISSEEEVVRVFGETEEQLGQVTALVNNAGVLEPQMRVEAMTPERWSRVLAINVIGSFLCAREAIKRMSMKSGGNGGVIVNVSSIAAKLGAPGEYVDYAASKAAVDAMTMGLAKEVATEGIRVNAVRPGVIYTEIHASGGEPKRVDRVKNSVPMQRGGNPEEVASAILWLLSEEASYVTGAFVDVTGGR